MQAEDTSVEIDPIDPYSDWFGFDTENDKTGKVTLAALIHESGAKDIWKRSGGFGEWCEKQQGKKTKPVVICHNLEYDLVNEFGRDKYAEFQLNYLKGRLISAKFGNIKFLDSFNHFRMRLADIGDAIGIPKMEMDIDNPDYVTRDAWICLKAMTGARDYIASLGGKIGATSGSSSLSVWKYMTESEYCTGPHDTPWMRKGYYGGRTEIFRPSTICQPQLDDHGNPVMYQLKEDEYFIDYEILSLEDIKSEKLMGMVTARPGDKVPVLRQDIRAYDINSMYPFCMLNDFPEYLMDDSNMSKAKGMAEVTISIPHDMFIGPLVYRATKGELLYPVGVITGVWTYDEIRMAERLGAKVLKVHKAIGCNMLVRPFDQFINTLYLKRKQSTNEAERLFLKVLMNSLYGKIASKNEVTRTVSKYNLLKSNSKRLDEVKWINKDRGLLDYHTPQQDYVNVCWGSMITAYARNLLTKYLLKIPAEKLCYCDTDSIYCINHELPTSKELGDLKLETQGSVLQVVQPKAYRFDSYWKAKGVPKPRAVDSIDGSKKMEINFARQYIQEGFTAFEAPIRFRASLGSRRGVANQWVEHSKGRKSAYTAKRLSGDRYVPPVIAEQMDLFHRK